MSGIRTNSGRALNKKWQVGAEHALYRQDGKFYMHLNRFPGALFDEDGYVLFKTENEYLNCSSIKIGARVNVKGGISSLPGYVRMK